MTGEWVLAWKTAINLALKKQYECSKYSPAAGALYVQWSLFNGLNKGQAHTVPPATD